MAARKSVTFPIPEGSRVASCLSCNAPIVWIVTTKGKRMPVEVESEKRGESHFANCAQANAWRKPR